MLRRLRELRATNRAEAVAVHRELADAFRGRQQLKLYVFFAVLGVAATVGGALNAGTALVGPFARFPAPSRVGFTAVQPDEIR